MAVLETETKYYYKINPERSKINNHQIYVSLTTYFTKQDRDYEKKTEGAYNTFLLACSAKLNEYDAKINLESTEQIIDERNRFERAVYNIMRTRFREVDNAIDIDILRVLESCGYNSEWVSTPIRIVGTMLVNVGLYDGIELTAERLYNRLKLVMSTHIEDV